MVNIPKPFEVSDRDAARFWTYVDKGERDWLWTGSVNARGYGQFHIGTRASRINPLAHNVAWVILRGPMPPNLQPDHTCLIHRCVNPDCIEWVTNAENMRRRAMRSEYCKSGLHRWDQQVPVMEYDKRDGQFRRRCVYCKQH